jgi:hypothetical protein
MIPVETTLPTIPGKGAQHRFKGSACASGYPMKHRYCLVDVAVSLLLIARQVMTVRHPFIGNQYCFVVEEINLKIACCRTDDAA